MRKAIGSHSHLGLTKNTWHHTYPAEKQGTEAEGGHTSAFNGLLISQFSELLTRGIFTETVLKFNSNTSAIFIHMNKAKQVCWLKKIRYCKALAFVVKLLWPEQALLREYSLPYAVLRTDL